jgi:hypothetical protein
MLAADATKKSFADRGGIVYATNRRPHLRPRNEKSLGAAAFALRLGEVNPNSAAIAQWAVVS